MEARPAVYLRTSVEQACRGGLRADSNFDSPLTSLIQLSLQEQDYIVLYCIVLYCIVLYCIVLYCIVFYCIVLYFNVHGWYKHVQPTVSIVKRLKKEETTIK